MRITRRRFIKQNSAKVLAGSKRRNLSPLAEKLESRTLLTAVVVNTILDNPHPAGLISLRDAITTANSSATLTTITFDSAVFAIPKTITLNGNELDFAKSATIKGPAAGVTINGAGLSRIFYTSLPVALTLSGLTITNAGRGAIFNNGALTMTSGAITNSAGSAGAGIYNTGTVTLSNVTLSGNKSPSSTGGAIYNIATGKITLTNVTVSGNSASEAAGIYSYGMAILTNVTVSGNTAAGTAGGIENGKNGVMSLTNVTVSGNTAAYGGGIFAVTPNNLTIANSIIAGNTTKIAIQGPDVNGPVNSLGFNLVGKTDGSTGWVATDHKGTGAAPVLAKLGALANNGGPTFTLLPLTGSPAIDHGSNALIHAGSTTDQRGLPRVGNAIVDIGAVEVQPPAGSIAGTVLADLNGNGKLDTGEKGIAGVKVYIDANKNGSPDATEASVLTDAAGVFKFTNLAAGIYRVRQVLPTGNVLIAPASGFFDITVAGGAVTGSLFADKPTVAANASIAGRVFGDSNNNGLRDPGEVGMGLWKVYLDLNSNGVLDAKDLSATTDIVGNWSFTKLAAGTYVVRIVPVAGLAATKPTGGVLTIKLTAGQASVGNLFGERATDNAGA